MSYSYQETGGILTKTSGGFIVAHDGEGFEPFARTLTVSGNAVVYDDISVSSGGILYVGTKTVLSDCEAFAGGTITASAAAVLSDCVIHSGGTLTPTGGAQRYFDLTVEAGAKLINVSANTVFGGTDSPYIWMQTPHRMKSWEFFDLLLNEANVVGTPGEGFGPSGEGYFRLTAFNTKEKTEEAVRRIAKVLTGL